MTQGESGQPTPAQVQAAVEGENTPSWESGAIGADVGMGQPGGGEQGGPGNEPDIDINTENMDLTQAKLAQAGNVGYTDPHTDPDTHNFAAQDNLDTQRGSAFAPPAGRPQQPGRHSQPAGDTVGTSAPQVDVQSGGVQRPPGLEPRLAPKAPKSDTEIQHGSPKAPSQDIGELVMKLGHVQRVDVTSGKKAYARDRAQERLDEATSGEAGFSWQGIKNFFNNGIKGNFLRTAVINNYRRKAESEIAENQDVHFHHEGTSDEHVQAMDSLVHRFASTKPGEAGHVEGHLHTGEVNEELEKSVMEETEHGQAFAAGLRNLVSEYAKPVKPGEERMDADTFQKEEKKLWADFDAKHYEGTPAALIEGRMHVTNMLKFANTARTLVDEGESMDRVDAALKVAGVKLGVAQLGARTEVERDLGERLEYKLQNGVWREKLDNGNWAMRQAGRLVNESTIGAATAVAATVVSMATNKSLAKASGIGAAVGLGALTGGASFAVMAGAAVGAGIAGAVRERTKVQREWEAHSRDMAVGGTVIETDKGKTSRERLEKTRYETKTAKELMDALDVDMVPAEGEPASTEVQAVNIRRTLDAIADAKVRIQLSDDKSRDFISYSSKTSVEAERTGLDIKLAQTQLRMNRLLGLGEDGKPATASNELLEAVAAKRVAGASVEQGIISVRDAADTRAERAVMQTITDGQEKYTSYARGRAVGMFVKAGISSLVGGAVMQEAWGAFSPSVKGIFDTSNAGAEVKTPGAALVEKVGEASQDFQQTDAGKSIQEFFGSAKAESGKLVHDLTGNESQQGGGYQLKHVMHDRKAGWMDNNTSKKFDKNELGLHWGKNAGHDGNFSLDVKSMTENGSSHGHTHLNAEDLTKKGDLKLAVSVNKDSQDQVFMLNVKTDGSIDIPKDSPLSQLFGTDKAGKPVFKGGFAEVVHVSGTNPDQSQTIQTLATMKGSNSAPRDIFAHAAAPAPSVGAEVASDGTAPIPMEFAAGPALYGTRGLEPIKRGERPANLAIDGISPAPAQPVEGSAKETDSPGKDDGTGQMSADEIARRSQAEEKTGADTDRTPTSPDDDDKAVDANAKKAAAKAKDSAEPIIGEPASEPAPALAGEIIAPESDPASSPTPEPVNGERAGLEPDAGEASTPTSASTDRVDRFAERLNGENEDEAPKHKEAAEKRATAKRLADALEQTSGSGPAENEPVPAGVLVAPNLERGRIANQAAPAPGTSTGTSGGNETANAAAAKQVTQAAATPAVATPEPVTSAPGESASAPADDERFARRDLNQRMADALARSHEARVSREAEARGVQHHEGVANAFAREAEARRARAAAAGGR